jgi:hypothetical protein
MSEEVDPPDNLAVDKMHSEAVQHLLKTTRFMMGAVSHELKVDISRASSIALSILSTAVMVYIRGYPREHWGGIFQEVAQYFQRMADEAEQKGANNDEPNNVDS